MIQSVASSPTDLSAAEEPATPLNAGLSLRALALRGSLWTIGGYGTTMVLRLASNLILTRLLVPEMFGVMVPVTVFIQGLQMFSDLGIGPSIIQNKRGDDPVFLNTAWTIQVLRGIALWVVSCLIAWPVALWYETPLMAWLLPVAGLTALFAGFNSTKVVSAERHLALGRLTMLDLVAQVAGVTITIVWAWADRSIWPLVWGGVLTCLFKAVLSHFVLPGRKNRFCWESEARHALFHFGKWIFLSSMVFFMSQVYDRLVLGSYVEWEMLGFYGIAVMLAGVPTTLNLQLSRSILYPSISRIFRDQPHRVSEVYYRTRRSMDLLFMPAIGFVMASGSIIVGLLYDDRYAQVGWMLQILSLRAAMRCMLEPCDSCLTGIGFPRYGLIQNILRFTWILTGVPIAWHYYGLEGIVWIVALSEVIVLPWLWWALQKRGILKLSREAYAWLLLLLGVVVGHYAAVLNGYFQQ